MSLTIPFTVNVKWYRYTSKQAPPAWSWKRPKIFNEAEWRPSFVPKEQTINLSAAKKLYRIEDWMLDGLNYFHQQSK